MKTPNERIFAYILVLLSLTTFDLTVNGKTVWRPVSSRDEIENATTDERFIIVAPDADRILCYGTQQYIGELYVTPEISFTLPDEACKFIVQRDDFERIYFKLSNRNLYLSTSSATNCISTSITTLPADFTDFPSIKLGSYYISFNGTNFVRSTTKTSSAQIYKSYEVESPLVNVKFYIDDEEIADGDVINDGVGKTLHVDASDECRIFYKDENDATEHIMQDKSLTFTHPGTYEITVIDNDEEKLSITIIINGLFSENGLDFTKNLYGFTVLPTGEWQTTETKSFSVRTDYGVDMFIPKGQNIALRQNGGQQYLEMETGTCFNIAIQERRIVGIIIEGSGLENITFRRIPEMGNTVPTHEQIFSSMLYVDRQTAEETKAVWSAYEGTNITGIHIVNGRDEDQTRSSGGSAQIYSIGLKFDIPTDVSKLTPSLPLYDDEATFFDLSGRQLPSMPTVKGIYIVRTGTGFRKILVN